MALSANTRKLNEYPNLVLLLDFVWTDDGERMDHFMARVYEADPQILRTHYPYLPLGSEDQIFHCYGKRFPEFQAALTFLDVLLGIGEKTGLRATLESRILGLTSRRPIRYTVCHKIRYEGVIQDPSLPESRTAQEFVAHPPAVVPEDGFTTIKDAIEYTKSTAEELKTNGTLKT